MLRRFFCAYNDNNNGEGSNDSTISASTGPPSSDEPKQKIRKVRHYAELVSDRGIPSDVAPLKVLVNETICNAVDTLKDSHLLAQQLSKSLLLDFLHNPNSKNYFGQFLNDMFKYESLKAPTRDIIYWSITTPNVHYYIHDFTKYQAKEWLKYSGPSLVSGQLIDFISAQNNIKEAFAPMMAENVIRNPFITIDPLTGLIVHSLPLAKPVVMDGLKSVIQETLKSEKTKSAARDVLLSLLRKSVEEEEKEKGSGSEAPGQVRTGLEKKKKTISKLRQQLTTSLPQQNQPREQQQKEETEKDKDKKESS